MLLPKPLRGIATTITTPRQAPTGIGKPARRVLACVALFCGASLLAQAQVDQEDVLPEGWRPTLSVPVDTGGLPVPLHGELTTELITRFEAIRRWMTSSARKTKELRTDVDELQEQVYDLQQAVAKLQQQQPPAQPPGGQSPAAANEARIKALEDRVAKLEAERNVLRAPLTVLGNGGKPVLQLSADGFMLLGFAGGNQIGLLAQSGSPARIGVQSGSHVAQMVAGNGSAVIEALNGEAFAAGLSASATAVGVLVESNGIAAARLGSLPGKGVALRLYDKGGKQVAAAGENPATPGTGLMAVGNGSQNSAALAANNDGSGVAHAFAADGSVGSGLIGKDRMVAAYNASGNAVVTIGKSENSEGGNVTSRDPAGDGVFRAGFNSVVGGGDACVFRAKKQQTYCLGLGVPGVGLVGR